MSNPDILGTEGAETLNGTAGGERIFGFGGKDRIYAQAGNDELYGGAANDTLDGGEGRDLMYGGAGDDAYRVDHPGDVVSEETTPGQNDGGTDTVTSTISWSLGAFIEKLTLTGGAAIDAVGNSLGNSLKGNDADNVLSGGAGTDSLYGNAGDDTLIGGLGKDYYYGGAGADTFVLRTEAGVYDKIYDWAADDDRLGIYAGEFGLSEGAGLTGGVLDADYFVNGTAATAAGHGQFVLKAALNELWWDANGAAAGGALRIAVFTSSAGVTADRIVAMNEDAHASVQATSSGAEAEGGPVYFALKLTQPLNEDVILTCSTENGSAVGGQDFVALSSVDVLVKAGSTTAYVPVELLEDFTAEGTEGFSLRLDSARIAATGASLGLDAAVAGASIKDAVAIPVHEAPRVVAHHFTGSDMTDPSAIAYDPYLGKLFMADSEVDEAPFSQPQNFFTVDLQANVQSKLALPFTKEPTGLAFFDGQPGRADDLLFITDDDKKKVFCVDPDAPDTVLWQFSTNSGTLGGIDPEDIAVDSDGDLFICNGENRKIIEVDQHGTTLKSSFILPTEIRDPEALCFDAREQVFYVGGGFSDKIWVVDRDGDVLEVLNVLAGARAPGTNNAVSVKDLDLAPASDGSGETHLYVADYGDSHVNDGRLLEIDLGSGWLIA